MSEEDDMEFKEALRAYLDTFGEGPPLLMMEHFEDVTEALKEAVRAKKKIRVGRLNIPPDSFI